MRRGDIAAAVAAKLAVAQVVGDDQDDVRPRLGRRGCPSQHEECKQNRLRTSQAGSREWGGDSPFPVRICRPVEMGIHHGRAPHCAGQSGEALRAVFR